MDAQQRLDLITCPHCGARRPNTAERCWLCGVYRAELAGTLRPIEPVRPIRSTPLAGNLAAILAALVVALVAIGVVDQAPGFAVLLFVVVVPAFIALGVTMGREGMGGPSFMGVFATLMLSAVGMIIIVSLTVVAAVGALLAFCFMLIGGIGPH